MRARSSISELLGRRWVPFAGLALGSLAFVALTVALIPDHLGAPAVPSENHAAAVATEVAMPVPAAQIAATPAPKAASVVGSQEALDSSDSALLGERHVRRRSKPSTNPPKDPVLLPPFVAAAPLESQPSPAQ